MLAKLAIPLVIIWTGLAAFGQTKPDLIVAGLGIEPDPSGRFVARVTVTVSNGCRGSATGVSFVLVTFKENGQAGSKSIYFVGSRVNPLKGGDSQTLTFEAAASGKQITLDRHVVAEVDPYRKIAEASESNNWRTINPGNAGTPQCGGSK